MCLTNAYEDLTAMTQGYVKTQDGWFMVMANNSSCPCLLLKEEKTKEGSESAERRPFESCEEADMYEL